MLKITLPPNEVVKHNRHLWSPTIPQPSVLHKATQEVVEESRRWAAQAAARQEIINKLVKECPFKVGDEVTCHSESARNKHGHDVVINKIVTSYAQIKTDVWPENDQPMIIHAYSRDKDYSFICTSGYLIHKPVKTL